MEQEGGSKLAVDIGGDPHEIAFQSMRQTNLRTGAGRRLRRTMLGRAEPTGDDGDTQLGWLLEELARTRASADAAEEE